MGAGQEFLILVRATGELYRSCLVDAVARLRVNPLGIVMPIAYLIISALITPIVFAILGGVVGGFLLGFIGALFVPHYLLYVQCSVRKERLFVRESLQRCWGLLPGTISVLFILWILSFLISRGFSTPDTIWIAIALNVGIFIAFNPAFEAVYLTNAEGMSLLGHCLEFMKENAPEWLVPLSLFILPLAALDTGLALSILSLRPESLLVFTLQTFAEFASSSSLVIEMLLGLIALAVAYAFAIFRGLLFGELSRSGRRKRIYASKFR